MNKTNTGWVKNPDSTQGYTQNSKTGCENHTLGGLCLGGMFPCYAYRLAHGRLRQRYLANPNLPLHSLPYSTRRADPFYPRFWPDRVCEVYRHKEPAGIFLDDMADWMGGYWPVEWTQLELQMMRDNPRHRIYTLTKQPQNLPQWSPFPDNCWVGVTATNRQAYLGATGARGLVGITAKVKFISIEPLLEQIGASEYRLGAANWLIIGALTGSRYDLLLYVWNHYGDGECPLTLVPYGNKWALQPPIEWVEEIVTAAVMAGIPVFLKDNLKPLLANEVGGETVIESHNLWAFKQFKLRQEMPR